MPPRQPCSIALERPIESPAPPALSNLLSSTSSSLVAFPLTSQPAAPPSRAARTPAPLPRAPATALPVPPLVRPHHVPHTSTTHATSCPHFRRLWPRPTILRHDPGLAASPPVRYKLRVAGRGVSLPLCYAVRWNWQASCQAVDTPRTGTRRWPRRMSHRPMSTAKLRSPLVAN
jgi:hypothetical protein